MWLYCYGLIMKTIVESIKKTKSLKKIERQEIKH